MFDRWLKFPVHKYLHLTAILILVVGINVNHVLMSIGTIWIVSNALIQADFKFYWKQIKKNKFLWVLIAFTLLHFLSLIWSENVSEGMRDIRLKLPLFVIPLIIGIQKPINHTIFKWILIVFISTVCITSSINYFTYSPEKDIREMSQFISHVRFSISINLAIAACVYLMIERSFKWFYLAPVIPWLIFYIYKSQVLTGYILFVILIIMVIYYSFKRLNVLFLKYSFSILLLFILIGGGAFLYMRTMAYLNKERMNFSELETRSNQGNTYFHDTTSTLTENGNYVWIYIQYDELKKGWNNISTFDYGGEDKKGQPLYGTLMRYLSSKGDRKDAQGIQKLSPTDIARIENGNTSINTQNGLMTKLDVILLEMFRYQGGGDPNGSTILQRKEHFRIAGQLLADNWVFGSGIGDIDDLFAQYYLKFNSKLSIENQWGSHNQYMTTWIGLGLLGFLLFTALAIYPLFTPSRFDFYFCFIAIVFSFSALFQDILETQSGITIFSTFIAFALFVMKPKHGRKLKLV